MIETIINLPMTPPQTGQRAKDEERARIAADTEAFLAAGGQIQCLDVGDSQRNSPGWNREHVDAVAGIHEAAAILETSIAAISNGHKHGVLNGVKFPRGERGPRGLEFRKMDLFRFRDDLRLRAPKMDIKRTRKPARTAAA